MLLLVSCLLVLVAVLRVLQCLARRAFCKRPPRRCYSAPRRSSSEDAPQELANATIVLGSGGHSGEMFSLIKDWSRDKWSFQFVISVGDESSVSRLGPHGFDSCPRYFIRRSRRVGEGWVSSFRNTVLSSVECLSLWRRIALDTDLLLVNGPGVCVPVVLSAFFWEVLGFSQPKIIFVESFCRTKSISLAGKLIRPFCDRFVVMWPQLADGGDQDSRAGDDQGRGRRLVARKEYCGTLL